MSRSYREVFVLVPVQFRLGPPEVSFTVITMIFGKLIFPFHSRFQRVYLTRGVLRILLPTILPLCRAKRILEVLGCFQKSFLKGYRLKFSKYGNSTINCRSNQKLSEFVKSSSMSRRYSVTRTTY